MIVPISSGLDWCYRCNEYVDHLPIPEDSEHCGCDAGWVVLGEDAELPCTCACHD